MVAGSNPAGVAKLKPIIEALDEAGARVDYHDPYFPVLPATRRHAALAGKASVALEGYNPARYVGDNQSQTATSGGTPSRSAALPSTRSAARAMARSRSSAIAGAVSCSPTGMPIGSRPTGKVIAQKPR